MPIDWGSHLLGVISWVSFLPFLLWRLREVSLPPIGIVFCVWVLGTSARLFYLQDVLSFKEGAAFVDLAQSVETGLWVLCISSLLIALGYSASLMIGRSAIGLPRGRDGRRFWPAAGESEEVDVQVLRYVGLVAYSLGLSAICGFLWWRFGGWPGFRQVFATSSATRSFELAEGVTGNAAGLLALCWPAELVSWIVLWWAVNERRTTVAKKVGALAVFLAGLLLSMSVGIVLGSRWGTIKPLLMSGWAWALLVKARFAVAGVVVIGSAVAAAPILYLQGEIRANWQEGEAVLDQVVLNPLEIGRELILKLGETGHFVAVERTGYISEYVLAGLNEFPLGGSFVSAIVGLVPRAVYPNKPVIHEGVFVAERIAGVYSGAGYPAGLIGGLLLNFGPLGLLALIAYGASVAYLDGQAGRAAREPRAFLVVMTFGVVITFDLLQSGIATSLVTIIVKGGVLAVISRIVIVRRTKASRAARVPLHRKGQANA
jgi:hypothetical protein